MRVLFFVVLLPNLILQSPRKLQCAKRINNRLFGRSASGGILLEQATVWCFAMHSHAKVDNDALACWQQLMQDILHYATSQGIALSIELYIEPG